MKALAIFAALLGASPVSAQAMPYKLVILWGNSGIAVVDYQSARSCETAKLTLERRKESELQLRQPKEVPGGGMIFPAPWQMEMVCIPG